MSMKNRFKTRIKKLLLPLATLFLINIPSKYFRKKFAKLVGPYFEGNVAKTIHGFPMITKWHEYGFKNSGLYDEVFFDK